MAKTKPIGVRFDKDLLESTKLTPQSALKAYEDSYRSKVVKDLTKSNVEVKAEIPPQSNYVIDTVPKSELAGLEAELAAIPDKTKGNGKFLAKVLQQKIDKLK